MRIGTAKQTVNSIGRGQGLPFDPLWYGEPSAISNAIGHAQFILLSWFGTPCVLAIPPSPRLRCAQAKEEEVETL